MANGIINLGSTRDVLEGRIVWSSVSNGSVANTSNVTAELQMRRNDGYTTTGTWTGSLNIGGQVETFSTHQSLGTSWVSLMSFTKTISHSSDGTGTCYLYAKGNGPSGTSMAGHYVEGSQTVTLDRIARASTVTCPDGNIGSSTIININRSSDSFTHTLRYSFGNLTGTIVTKTNQTSYGWTIPTTFYAQIPNASNGTGTVFCDTYSGNTLVGTSTTTFKAFVVNSNPTISATIIDTNSTTTSLTGNNNKLVKYYSNAKVTLTATARNSATIVQKRINGEVISGNDKTINNVEIKQFTVDCTDSRGFVGTATYTKSNSEWVEYVRLALTNVTIARTGSTSNTVTATIRGNYYNGSFGSQNNSLTLRWRYKEKNGTYSGYTTVTATLSGNTFSYSGTLGTNFDYQKEYIFEVQAIDKLVTVTRENTVTAGIPLIDLWKDNIKITGNLNVNGNLDFSNNGEREIIWKEAGYGDKFSIKPSFSGSGDTNLLKLRGTVGDAGTDPTNWKDLLTISAYSGNTNILGALNLGSTLKSKGYFLFALDAMNASGRYYKLCNIKASDNGNNVSVNIKGSIGNWTTTKGIIDLLISNREGLRVRGNYMGNGAIFDQQSIVIYKESNNSHTIYLKNVTSFTGPNTLEIYYGQSGNYVTIYTDYSYVTSPSGTLAWTSSPNNVGNIDGAVRLYNNGTGTTGTVTLSETAANFTYLEIFFHDDNEVYNMARVFSPNNKTVFMINSYLEATTSNIKMTQAKISGTTITPQKYSDTILTKDNTVGITWGQNYATIVRVDGYR